jgi:hypothetical protein
MTRAIHKLSAATTILIASVVAAAATTEIEYRCGRGITAIIGDGGVKVRVSRKTRRPAVFHQDNITGKISVNGRRCIAQED